MEVSFYGACTIYMISGMRDNLSTTCISEMMTLQPRTARETGR